MKTTLLLFFLAYFSLSAMGQTPEIPVEYILDKKEDYKPYEAKVKELIKWLETTPIGIYKKERQAATKFVFDWINGCPYVSVALHDNAYNGLVYERYHYASELVMAYQFGMCLYILKHPDHRYKGTESILQEIGIQNMVTAYQKAKNKNRSSFMEKFQKMIQKNKLSKWVKKNISFEHTKVQNMPTNKPNGKKT